MKTVLTTDFVAGEKINKLSFYDVSGNVAMVLNIKGEFEDLRHDYSIKDYIILFFHIFNGKLLKQNLKELLYQFEKHINSKESLSLLFDELIIKDMSRVLSELQECNFITAIYDEVVKDYVYELTPSGRRVVEGLIQQFRKQCILCRVVEFVSGGSYCCGCTENRSDTI